MKKQVITAIMAIVFSVSALANIKTQTHNSSKKSIAQWEVLDISFKARPASDNPFVTNFEADFVSPSGKRQTVAGFYNGSNSWLLRFSGSEEGEWQYTTHSELKALDSKKGKVFVTKSESSKHGAVVIDPVDKQHFYYEDGTPYFLMAFECDWLYALDYKNEEAMPRTHHFLNHLSKNGFNQIVMNVYTFDIQDKSHEWTRDEKLQQNAEYEFGGDLSIFPFKGNNQVPDYTLLNVEYFKKLDRTIALMHDKNIVSHLMIYVWNKLVNWPEMYSEADNMYFDYVVKRYGAFPNVMWDISKEALYYGRADDAYITERTERLRKANYFKRLLTVHDYGFCKRHPDAVDYISRQDWSYQLYQNMLNDYKHYNNKPVFNIEHGGYEEASYQVFSGSYTNAEECLRRNYQCAFAGVYSTHYWQAAAWNVVVWNPEEQSDGAYVPKLHYYKHMADLFTTYPFNTLAPVPWRNQAGYALKHQNKEQYLFYVPKETFLFRAQFMFDAKEKKPVSYKWYNTYTGQYSEEVEVIEKQNFHSPWYLQADCVLIMECK